MIESGLGATHVNKMLSALNIPGVGFGSIKRHEEVVGQALSAQAEISMENAILKEKNLTW